MQKAYPLYLIGAPSYADLPDRLAFPFFYTLRGDTVLSSPPKRQGADICTRRSPVLSSPLPLRKTLEPVPLQRSNPGRFFLLKGNYSCTFYSFLTTSLYPPSVYKRFVISGEGFVLLFDFSPDLSLETPISLALLFLRLEFCSFSPSFPPLLCLGRIPDDSEASPSFSCFRQ